MSRIRFIIPAFAFALTSGVFAQSVGTSFCSPTHNSTGAPTLMAGTAGGGVGSNLHLEVTQGVPDELGYFLAGNEVTAGVAVGNGMLCLVGTGTAVLHRYNVARYRVVRGTESGQLQSLLIRGGGVARDTLLDRINKD